MEAVLGETTLWLNGRKLDTTDIKTIEHCFALHALQKAHVPEVVPRQKHLSLLHIRAFLALLFSSK